MDQGRSTTQLTESVGDVRRYTPGTTAESRDRYEQQERDREQERKNRYRASVWKSLVESRGARYAGCRLNNFEATTDDQKSVVSQLREYVADFEKRFGDGQNILLIGPPGTGKDHLAFAMAWVAVANYRDCFWVNGTSLWLLFRTAISREWKGSSSAYKSYMADEYGEFDSCLAGDESHIVSKLQNVDLLCLSDPVPPGGSLTDYQAGTLFEIIDHRYNHRKPTYLTLNASNRQEAEQRIGAQTIDRLGHDALALPCNWPSYRQKQEASK